jgi:hypothetical protein
VRDGTPQNNLVKNATVAFSILTDPSGGSLTQPAWSPPAPTALPPPASLPAPRPPPERRADPGAAGRRLGATAWPADGGAEIAVHQCRHRQYRRRAQHRDLPDGLRGDRHRRRRQRRVGRQADRLGAAGA